MADETAAPRGEGKAERRGRGFRAAGALIAPQTRAAAGRRGYAEARLKALWTEIAGPEIAAVARPAKLTLARGPAGGLLTLAVLGANGPQVQMLAPLVRERVNAALGPGAVGRVQITQAAGFAEPPPPAFGPSPRRGPEPESDPGPEPEPAAMAELAEPLSSIGDPELRAALETLAKNVVSRAANARGRGAGRRQTDQGT